MATFTNAGGSLDGIVGTTTSHDHNGVEWTQRQYDGAQRRHSRRQRRVRRDEGPRRRRRVRPARRQRRRHRRLRPSRRASAWSASAHRPTPRAATACSASPTPSTGTASWAATTPRRREPSDDAGGNGMLRASRRCPTAPACSESTRPPGIGVAGLGLIGVSGGSVNGVGVMGVSMPPGGTNAGDGVQGITNSAQRNGIYGVNQATGAHGSSAPTGNGVLGFSHVSDGAGVLGAHGSGGHGLIGTGGFGDNRVRHRDRRLGHCPRHRVGRVFLGPDQGRRKELALGDRGPGESESRWRCGRCRRCQRCGRCQGCG